MASARTSALALASALALLAVAACPTRSPPAQVGTTDAGTVSGDAPAVILLIGDGMGKGQLEAAAYFHSGSPDGLHVFTLPHQGEVVTGSPSGITDSAASATAIATGVPTFNGRVGLDRDGNRVQNLVERAHERGWAVGVVTTTSITHATPAAFTAHVSSRGESLAIADQQAFEARAEVMLGGGARYFRPAGTDSARDDEGLLDPLEESGYQIVTTAAALDLADPARGQQLVGLFADYHMTYELDRGEESTEPTLAQMTRVAIAFLERNPHGFFLMVEGGLIDPASHGNDLERTVAETVAFDLAVQAATEWAQGRENVTILVTADHETGGLEVVAASAAGEYPATTWRRSGHTSDRVRVLGSGPGSEWIQSEVRDHRWIHAIARAGIEQVDVRPPQRLAIPNGDLRDLRHVPCVQAAESGFGPGFNQLDSLHVDADEHGLAIGVGGLFERGENALVVLVDEDFGSSSGPARLTDALADETGTADSIVSSLALDASAVAGFGTDFAFVVFGGEDPTLVELSDSTGLRGLHPPFGFPDNLAWLSVPVIFAEGVRPSDRALSPRAFEGFETLIPWTRLYPDLDGAVPRNATIALAAVLVNDDGGYTSNQALPPFPTDADNPGRTEVALPGVVVFRVDSDGDAIADGDATPQLVMP